MGFSFSAVIACFAQAVGAVRPGPAHVGRTNTFTWSRRNAGGDMRQHGSVSGSSIDLHRLHLLGFAQLQILHKIEATTPGGRTQ